MGTSYAPNIVKDGLVLNVDPANLRSYPRSGTDVTDLVNNVTGDVNNGASWSNRKLGAFYYDRVNNNLSWADGTIDVEMGTLDFSIESWFETIWETPTYFQSLFFKGGAGATGYGFGLRHSSEGNVLYANLDPSNAANTGYNSTTIINPNQCYQAVWTADRDDLGKMYINGEFVQSFDISDRAGSLSNSAQGTIGCYREYGDFPFYGYIYNTKVYKNKALSAQEVKQNYNALKGRFQ